MSAHELVATGAGAASEPTLRFVDRVNPATRLAAAMVLTTPLLLTVAVRPSFAGTTYGGGGGDCKPRCEPKCGTQTFQSFYRRRR